MRIEKARLAIGAVFLLAAHGWAAPPKQASHGRIDIYVVNSAFDLTGARGSGLTTVGNCGWLGAGKENTGVSCDKALGREWEEVWVEFTAQGDGPVDIDLQGEWYGQEDGKDVRLVWADDVTVEGATIANPGFEEAGADGRPADWRFTGAFPAECYSRDGSVAHGGRSCVAVWYGSQARQAFTVEKGKTYRVRAWFRVLDPTLVKEPPYVPLAFPAETYEQEFSVTLDSEDAARQASIRMEPLYDGREWAVGSRWDDNNPDHLKMRDVLAKHGHFGTFYLNGLWRDWSGATTTTTSDYGRQLIEGGHAIGGHSLTHPLLSYCSRNRIFEEIAGVRMVWEAAVDKPVVSYSFSYCNFTNPQEGLAVQADIARLLERAGYYHVANEAGFEDVRTELMLSPIMPPDGQDIDPYVETVLGHEAFRERHPNLTYSMHTWYRTPEAWAKFEAQLEKYGHRPDWWYCNQNQYAAYRYQFLHCKLGAPVREGKTIRARLTRPVLLDLNDPVPLTFAVEGVARDAVRSVQCPTADVAVSDREGPFRFHLSHDRGQALPVKIGMTVPNTDNHAALQDTDRDTDFPGLRALLHYADGALRLTLANGGPGPLTDVRVTYRLPLAWKEGVARHHLGTVAANAQREDVLQPTLATDDYKLLAGNCFGVAQIDFRRAGEAGRLHAACNATLTDRDPSYAQGGFVKLGPLPPDGVDSAKLGQDLAAGRLTTQPCLLPDGTRLEWQADDGPLQPPYLDPDQARVSAVWYQDKPGLYVLQSTLSSPRAQAVRLRYLRGAALGVYLGGEDVTQKETVELKAGENRLAVVLPQQPGFFLQVLKPDSDERVTDVRFDPPELGAEAEEAYRVPGRG
jgi:peptidoglycan/xylan/chitin deacetylase (PgdA/CDA1 family)